MELHLQIIGVVLIVLALIHIVFPRYFNWKMELSTLSIINRQLMYVHAFFIALIVLLMGLLCLTSANELVHTNFGKRVSLGLAIFWIARLCIQFFGYSSKTWKGKKIETFVHIVFSMLWIYISTVFVLTYLVQNSNGN